MDDIVLPPVECTRCGKHAPDPHSNEADAWEMQILSLDGVEPTEVEESNAAMLLWCPECAAKPVDPNADIAIGPLQARANYARLAPEHPGDLSGESLIDDLIKLHNQGDKLDDTMRAILAEQLQQELRVAWYLEYSGGPKFAKVAFTAAAVQIAVILAESDNKPD